MARILGENARIYLAALDDASRRIGKKEMRERGKENDQEKGGGGSALHLTANAQFVGVVCGPAIRLLGYSLLSLELAEYSQERVSP